MRMADPLTAEPLRAMPRHRSGFLINYQYHDSERTTTNAWCLELAKEGDNTPNDIATAECVQCTRTDAKCEATSRTNIPCCMVPAIRKSTR